MSGASIAEPACSEARQDEDGTTSLGAADWLCFAATPGFALMALLTAAYGSGPTGLLCSAAQGATPFGGMVPMYMLMSAFHSAPWVKLVSRRGITGG